MRAFYNEIDGYCCSWLSNLMDAGLITPGRIDDRSIHDVRPDDLVGYTRVHFFAGIAGWDHALNLAGWGDREVWTGSCPCQPFSVAGKRKGFDDERHLWPVFRDLIAERRPSAIFGEQVGSATAWLAGVRGDLEALGYAVGAMPIEAASVGAPHKRDRFWFVADGADARRGDSKDGRADRDGEGPRKGSARENAGLLEPERTSLGELADTDQPGSQGRQLHAERAGERAAGPSGLADADFASASEERAERGGQQCGPRRDPWAGAVWLTGADGKARRVEPGIRLLAHGVRNRVGRLRAYGNAIVPAVGAAFIEAYLDCARNVGN